MMGIPMLDGDNNASFFGIRVFLKVEPFMVSFRFKSCKSFHFLNDSEFGFIEVEQAYFGMSKFSVYEIYSPGMAMRVQNGSGCSLES